MSHNLAKSVFISCISSIVFCYIGLNPWQPDISGFQQEIIDIEDFSAVTKDNVNF